MRGTTKSQQPLSFTIPDLMFSKDGAAAAVEKRSATPPKKRDSSSVELSPTVVEVDAEKTSPPPVCMAEVMEEWMRFEGNDLAHLVVTKDLGGFICKKCDAGTVMQIDTMAKHCNGMRHKNALGFVGSLFEKGHMKPGKDFLVSMNEHRDIEVDCRICDETVVLRKTEYSWPSSVANHLKRKGHLEHVNRFREQSKEEGREALREKPKTRSGNHSRKRSSRSRPSRSVSTTPVKKNKPLVPLEPVSASPLIMEEEEEEQQYVKSPPPTPRQKEESPPPVPKRDEEQSLRPMSGKDEEEEDMREYLLEVRKETFRKLMEEHVKNEFAQLIKTLK